MLGKNNYNERLKKMEMQAKQDHFSIRKLTIGAASILLGFTFLGASSQTVKADTELTAQKTDDKAAAVLDKSTVNDNVVTSNSSNNTTIDGGNNKGAVNTTANQRPKTDDSVSVVQTDVAKKADTKHDTKKDLTKDHLQKDGSDQSDVESVRNNRKSDIESTIQTAQIRINKAYASSSKDQDDLQTKNDYLAQIDKIDTAVIAKLNAGKNVEEINSTAETAIKDILNLASAAELHFAKKTATDAITSKAKEVTDALTKDTDKDKVKQIVSSANQDLQKTTDVETANSIKDKTINELNNLKNIADAVEKAEVDTSKTSQTANIDKVAADTEKRIKDTYNNLPATTQSKVKDALNKAIADIEQTKTRAAAEINSATTVKDIVAAADNGFQQITASENQAYLSFAQGDAKETIKKAADKVTPDLSSADQNKVNDLLTQANASIDKATDLITVTTIKNNTVNEINNVKSNAEAAAKERLNKTKDLSKADVDEAAKQAISRVESAYKNLTAAEQTDNNAKYQKALTDIKAAQDAANTKIASAVSENEIKALVNDGISNINKVADPAELDFVIINIKDNIQNHANVVIDQLKTTEGKTRVKTIVGQAFDDLNSVQNVDQANKVKNIAIKSIDMVKDDEDLALQNSKDTSKANVDELAAAAKKRVNDAHDNIYNDLDDEDKKLADTARDNALKAINETQTTADAAIVAASDKSAVTNAVNKANKQFDQNATAAEITFAKLAAKEAVKNEAAKIIKDLKNQSDIDTVNTIASQANVDFENADSIDKVTRIKDKAIRDIDNIKTIADSVEKGKVENTKNTNTENINRAAANAKQRVKNAYDAITSPSQQTTDEYNKALSDIDQARDAANGIIAAATTVDEAVKAANQGISTVNDIADIAEISFAKILGKSKISDEDQKVRPSLSDQTYLDRLNKIVTDANNNLDNAKSVTDIANIVYKAISDIDSIKEISEAVEKAKLAASQANSHANLNSAAEAAKKQISEAYNKLNEDQKNQNKDKCSAALADIDTTAKKANDQIDKASDVSSITNIVTTAVNKFNETVIQAEVAFATVPAKEAVKAEADKISGDLSNQTDKDLVNKIVDQANTDFATADSIAKVYEIRDKAIKDIDAVKSNADKAAQDKLNDAKSAAIKELTEEQIRVNKAIDDLPNVSAENKSALKDKVNLYYQTAINNVEKAGDFDLVDKAKKDGLGAMVSVLAEASKLNQQIASDQKQLDDYAQKAIENINNSNLSKADKEKAIKAISQARDDAKNLVGQQPTIEMADNAEKAGEKAIDAAEKAASLTDLEGAKLIEKVKIENAAENAKNKVQAEYNNLDQNGKDKEKDKLATALDTIEKAKNDAETAISSATAKNAVSTISKTGIDKINGVTDDTSLEFAKEAAKETVQQISDIVKQNLKDPNDQNAVDKINKDAATSIDGAKTIPEVTQIRDDAINQIKQIKNAADAKENNDLSNAKSSSRKTVDVDATAAIDRVNKAYEKLTDAEKKAERNDYDAAIKAINDAKSAAEDKISSATNVDAINAAVSNAQQDFNTIATNAEVAFAKLAGKDKIQAAAVEADKVLSPKGQAAVKEIVTQANSDIEDAETVPKIEKITEAAIYKIKALKDSEKIDLEDAIKYANDEFEKKYKEAIARLKKEFSDSAQTTEVDDAYNKYKGITGSTVEEVNAKEIAAERELAKGEVRDTATNAETRVDNLKHEDGTDYTDNEKKALKNQIEKDVLEANGSKDQSGTLDKPSNSEGIDTARNDAVNKIISEVIADSQEGENVLQHDPAVLLERLAKAHKAAVDKLQKFGPNVSHDQTDKNYEEAKKALNTNPTDIATELAGEKLIANGALTDAKTAADNSVDSNADYSSTVKDKIKQQIQKDYDEATNRIKESLAVSELITQKRNDGIDQLYRDATDTNVNVTNVINSGGSSNQITNVTTTQPDSNQNTQTINTSENKDESTKTVKVVLKHNAYLYNNSGHRANGVTLGIGSILETIGTETINNRQYYVLVDQGANGKKYYVAVGNVKGTAKKLHHNAYIYNQYGKRVKKSGKLKSGKAIATYGSSVKIRGKKYFIIAKNRYVKAANVSNQNVPLKTATANQTAAVEAGDQSHIIVNKKIKHNAYLYDQNGIRANGLVINAGSNVDVVSQKVVNKKLYYVLEDGLYIAAGNIDAKKLKLKHNAYVYSKYGNRLGKKVLKKRKSIKAYGNPVKIKGKKYYTITTSKFVKKANVKG